MYPEDQDNGMDPETRARMAQMRRLGRVIGVYMLTTLLGLGAYVTTLQDQHVIPVFLFLWGLWVVWLVIQAMRLKRPEQN